MRKLRTLICLAAMASAATALDAQPAQVSFNLFDNGYNEPVFLTHAGDARMFVVEKDGAIKIVDQNGNVNGTPFMDINTRVGSGGNEQGLLGLAFHPKYKENGYFYVNYTNNSGSTVISRFSVSTGNPDIADPNSELIMMTISQPYSNHNGGCLNFGHDGYLYIGMGDGGSGGDPQNYAQSSNSRLGKMLRLDVDGGTPYGIPPSNAYQNTGNPTQKEIWAYGMRNPWRFSFDRQNGDLWIGDVGQDAWEEVDHLPFNSDQAPNFGWRCYEGNAPFNTSGCQAQSTYDPPIYVYANNGSTGCSMTGGYIYRGGLYGAMNGVYFHTDYCTGKIWQTRNPSPSNYTTTQGAAFETYDLVSFGEDVFGELYLIGISSGNIWRIADTSTAPIAMIFSPASITVCDSSYELRAAGTPSMSFQWQLNGNDIVGADTLVHTITQSGTYTVIVSNNGYTDTSSAVTVNFAAVPVVGILTLDSAYCTVDPGEVLIGQPIGGYFLGSGLSGSNFVPANAGVGTHTITYAYDAGYGCKGQSQLSTVVSVCVGLAPADFLPGFALYPNPATEQVSFRFDIDAPAEVEFAVFDLTGRNVEQGRSSVLMGTFQHAFDVQDLPAGLYTLRLRVGGQAYTKTFGVTH